MHASARPALLWAGIVFAAAAGGCRSSSAGSVVAGNALPPVFGAATTTAGETVVVVVNGADPLHVADVDAFAEQFRAAGYPTTRVVAWHDGKALERAIRDTNRDQPGTRFALIGYSLGTYTVRGMANRLARDGVPVVMVGYVGGDYLTDSDATRAGGAGRVVNVTGDGHFLTGGNWFFNGTEVAGARNLRLAGTRHFDLLKHPDTFATLHEELTAATAE